MIPTQLESAFSACCDERDRLQDINAELLAALEAIDAQVDEVGRHEDPPDYYAEVPWEFIDQARAAIAKAKDGKE